MSVVLFNGSHHLDRRALALIEEANRDSDDELLSTPRVAIWLGVSPGWLEIGRSKGWGPPFIKLSPRRVRYRVGDVKRWLAERVHRITAEYEQRLTIPTQKKDPRQHPVRGSEEPPTNT